MPKGKCADASKVTVPVFPTGGFPPAPITDRDGVASFGNACPFLDAADPLCCNSDTAQIMGKSPFDPDLDRFCRVQLPKSRRCLQHGLPRVRRQPQDHVVHVRVRPRQGQIL